MGSADKNEKSRPLHHDGPIPPPQDRPTYRSQTRRAYAHARDAEMNREDDGRRARGRSDREPYDRVRSVSPASRRPEASRNRDFPRDRRRDNFRDRGDIPHGHGPRRRSRSPSSPGKRRRSPSPVQYRSNKKTKREREREKRRAKKGHHRHNQSPSPHQRSLSPYRDHQLDERPDLFDPPPPRPRSRSPHHPREAGLHRGHSPHVRPRRNSLMSESAHSPGRDSHHSAFSRPQSPPAPIHSDAGSYSHRSTPAVEPPGSLRNPHSPRPDRPPPSGPSATRKKQRRDEVRLGKRGQPSSGANSIEVNMNRRVDARPNFDSNTPSSLANNRHNDPRHKYSPSHVASGSSRHGSPGAESPLGSGGRGGRNGQHFPSHGGLTANQAHFSQSPPHPPTGPSRGFSRGGFRGGNLNSTRNAARGGGFRPPTGPAAGRGMPSHSGDTTPNQISTSQHSDAVALSQDDSFDEATFESAREPPVDDTASDIRDERQMPPPGRAPPTGPAADTPSGPKFSFAFKATSKTPVAAPKPEISQKFSAAPPRREPPQPVDDRSNRDRDLPRDVPTGPASSRNRADHDYHGRQRAPEPPRPARAPRTRKVKKTERHLKPKPTLPEHLATSVSPFYRKPGNDSVVGSGTYGKVFKGTQVYTGRLVALKKIRMEGERDGFPVTAVREIKLLQSLRHENIVALQEVMVERNDCFMVFEYLSHDLTGLLNHPSFKLDPAQKKHLAKQLFEGLDYLHTRGVLHRDIKAANILVSSNGILKLADFGLARFYAKHHQNDYTNRVITIWYRSPELLLGETQYSAAVDIWSAACVMVEIFTRGAIFPGDGTEINQLDKIYAILGTPNKVEWPDVVKMEWFELLRPGYRKANVFAEKYKARVPAAAFELLSSMFRYDPDQRPSAAAVLTHPYFTHEHPPPRQAIELADIQGDWHEFESKALRREKERQEREAKRAADSRTRELEKTEKDKGHGDRDRKRPGSSHGSRDTKRPHVEGRPTSSGNNLVEEP